MLRAASLPGQQLSRHTVRVLPAPCRVLAGQSRRLHLTDQHDTLDHRAPPPHLDIHLQLNETAVRVSSHYNGLETTIQDSRVGAESTITDWASSTISNSPVLTPLSNNEIPLLYNHLDLMHTSKDVTQVWNSYEQLAPYLSDANRFAGEEQVLYLTLHRLVRMLASVNPRTRTVKLRIISVVSSLRNAGARVYAWERKLLKICTQGDDVRPCDFDGAKGVIGDALGSVSPRVMGDEDLSREALDAEVAELMEEPVRVQTTAEILKSPMLVPPLRHRFTLDSPRARTLNILATTQSFSHAWEAYRSFALLPEEHATEELDLDRFPQQHLHRLVSLLATVKPRTRRVYLCLVSILSTMRGHGYLIQLWEWNLLIDCSAKGWRKMRPEDYKAALRVFNDMLNYQKEMRQAELLEPLEGAIDDNIEKGPSGRDLIPIDDFTPDVYSYTTLIAHAARTLYPPTLQHARSLFSNSDLPPNRITLLAQMRFYTMRNQIFGVRHIVAEMRERGFELRNDGMNSLLWAFARNQQMDVAEAIYRVLRHNVLPEDPEPTDPDNIEATIRFLDESENILVPSVLVPDRITYTIMIQCCAYRGDLTRTLQIFMDMLQSPDPVAIWRGDDEEQARFVPMLPIYRAIFLGFYRHGVDPRRAGSEPLARRSAFGISTTPWNADNLYAIFNSFLQLPADQKPGDRVIYWLIMAFAKSSGYDSGRLRKVWKRLEKRFGNDWGSRLQKIRKSIYGNTEHTKVVHSEHDEDVTD